MLVDLSRPAPEVAPALIGCDLVCGPVRARITETEAYQGEEDRACHAHRGRTARTATLWDGPGTLYVYRCYGIHDLLNLVVDRAGVPAAVLVRSVRVVAGEALVRERRAWTRTGLERATNGPGKVTRALGIDRTWNRRHLSDGDCGLVLEPGQPPPELARGPRVGVDYAGPGWADRPWRWWWPDFPVVRNPTRD